LSVIPLGHLTYLKGKPGGENSMSGKLERAETVWARDQQDPDGMVKAELLEPQWPFCKGIRLDTTVEIQGFPDYPAGGAGNKDEFAVFV